MRKSSYQEGREAGIYENSGLFLYSCVPDKYSSSSFSLAGVF
jgi:hypothetical protein